MFSVQCEGFGAPSVLKIKKTDLPELKENEVLFKVKATSLNRADILQREGLYPAPPGASSILGLEASGYVMNSDGSYDVNQPMMCLLPGGGYAEYVAVNRNHLIPVPKNISIEEAGGLPEVWLTAYLNMKLANLNKNQNVMIYAGASGVGTSLIQLAKHYGLKSYVTCSTKKKISLCQKLGAEFGFHYKKMANYEIIEHFYKNSTLMDAIFDCVGQSNFDITSNLFNFDCKWVIYGTMSGVLIDEFDIATLMKKRAALITTTLRNRSDDFKTKLIEDFSKEILPGFLENKFQVIVDKKINISWDENGEEQVQNAHERMESNENIGKIILIFP